MRSCHSRLRESLESTPVLATLWQRSSPVGGPARRRARRSRHGPFSAARPTSIVSLLDRFSTDEKYRSRSRHVRLLPWPSGPGGSEPGFSFGRRGRALGAGRAGERTHQTRRVNHRCHHLTFSRAAFSSASAFASSAAHPLPLPRRAVPHDPDSHAGTFQRRPGRRTMLSILIRSLGRGRVLPPSTVATPTLSRSNQTA